MCIIRPQNEFIKRPPMEIISIALAVFLNINILLSIFRGDNVGLKRDNYLKQNNNTCLIY